MYRRLFLQSIAAMLTVALAPSTIAATATSVDTALISRLRRGGHVILMRHAATVAGIGDPPGFVLGECASQRNLSAAGLADAARIGAAFSRLGIPVDEVLSSRWCRCLDTARVAFGKVAPSPMLDSMFNVNADERDAKLKLLAAWVKRPHGGGNVVLVTHDVNIQALAQQAMRQGEMVVTTARPDGTLEVVGTLRL